ncbi:MAG TPA: hypothetical protein VFK80_11985, partial [Limnochordia bacterium]|nr:hypothetical protein [Limnochordia bacterium]
MSEHLPLFDDLRRLCETAGPSGREAPVAQVVESILTRARITARRDALGSVRARVRAARAERAP